MKKYFKEINNRTILFIFFIINNFFFLFYYKEFLLFSLLKIMYVKNIINNPLFFNVQNCYLIFTDVTEVFFAYLSLIFSLNLSLSSYFLATHIFFFLSPAFYKQEIKKIFFLIKSSFFAAFFSLIFSYFVLIPFTWVFFLKFQFYLAQIGLNSLYFETKLSEYVDFCLNIFFCSFFYFQTTVIVLFFYQKLDLLILRKFRKVFYYILLLFTFLVFPLDLMLNQLLGIFFLIFLLELVFFLSAARKILCQNKLKPIKIP